jgi:hypothetical protein
MATKFYARFTPHQTGAAIGPQSPECYSLRHWLRILRHVAIGPQSPECYSSSSSTSVISPVAIGPQSPECYSRVVLSVCI